MLRLIMNASHEEYSQIRRAADTLYYTMPYAPNGGDRWASEVCDIIGVRESIPEWIRVAARCTPIIMRARKPVGTRFEIAEYELTSDTDAIRP